VHFLGGMAVWLLSLGLFWHQFGSLQFERLFAFALASFFICFLGSLLPDADTPKSKIGGLLQAAVIATAFLFGATRFFRDFSTPVMSSDRRPTEYVTVTVLPVSPRHRDPRVPLEKCLSPPLVHAIQRTREIHTLRAHRFP